MCCSFVLVSCEDDEVKIFSGSGGGSGGASVPTMGDSSNKDDPANDNDGKYTKTVALTFDDGPHNTRTKTIVDELDKYGYHATFFVVGNRVDGTEYNGGDALKYAYEHGNEIGIHGYTHDVYYDTCSNKEFKSELSKTKDAIKKLVPDAKIKLMRPVGGKITEERITSCEYSVIMWDVDSEDWKHVYTEGGTEEANKKRDTIVENVMSQVKDGSIILMHDIRQSTCDATAIILKRLNEEGYNVVTVSKLLGKKLEAGKKYSRAPKTTETALADTKRFSLFYITNSSKCDELC
jgi:peptidoglycan/xylan/chitin deacetylase (PgdA/CDA1 family)